MLFFEVSYCLSSSHIEVAPLFSLLCLPFVKIEVMDQPFEWWFIFLIAVILMGLFFLRLLFENMKSILKRVMMRLGLFSGVLSLCDIFIDRLLVFCCLCHIQFIINIPGNDSFSISYQIPYQKVLPQKIHLAGFVFECYNSLQYIVHKIRMNRKPVFYSNKHERKNVIKFSPKMPAKRPEPLIRPQLKGQASAHMNRRKADGRPMRLQSPLYSRQKVQLSEMNEGRHILTEEQIKNSALYRMLEDEIKQLAQRQTQQLKKLKQIREDKKKEVEVSKKSQFQTKLQIWELKTEVYELKDSIEEEKNETERLMEEINHLSLNQHEHQFQSQGEEGSDSDQLSSDI